MSSPNQIEEQQQQKEDKEENTTASETKQQQQNEENSSRGGGGGGRDGGGSGGGWGGGWGFSSFSVLSDLQKAAEEISKNAVAVAKSAAKSITENGDDSESESPLKEKEEEEKEGKNDETGDKNEVLRDSALNRLENASEDTLLGQGLKALDESVESLASGAWLALGSAWKGGSALVHKLENSAVNLADSIQHGALPVSPRPFAPSILESGKSFTAKGIEVLERVGKETLDLLITETGLEIDKKSEHLADEEQFEEVNFEHCYYIYGGPDQLEELEALSNHYALLFNRKKTKLPSEQQSHFDGKLKQIQKLLDISSEIEEHNVDSDKGKHIEMSDNASGGEMKALHDSSVAKAADLAAGFAAALEGLAMNDIIQRTTDRLDTSHTECVHRLSELCSFAVANLLILGKSIISNINKKSEETVGDIKVDWPEDSEAKAKIIRSKAILMSGDVESVARSFITGISDITEAYQAATQKISSSKQEDSQKSIGEKASMISNHINTDQATALSKIQDGLQYLAYVVICTSMPSA